MTIAEKIWLKTTKFVVAVLDTGIQGYEAIGQSYARTFVSWHNQENKPDSSGSNPAIHGAA
jgi:hypothetical protein